MKRIVALFICLTLVIIPWLAHPVKSVAPPGWTEYNEPGAASNTWLEPDIGHITFEGDGSGGQTWSYLTDDSLSMTDFRWTGDFLPLDDSTNTAVGVVTHFAGVDDHTKFFIWEGDGGRARISREDAIGGGGNTIQHEVSITWQNNYLYAVDIRVFNDTMIVNLTHPGGMVTLAASIPISQLGNDEIGLVSYPIFDRGEAEWRNFQFSTFTNPKDVIVEDPTEHNAFPSGFYDGSDLHVIYRNAGLHNIDLNARLMEVTSSDEGISWSAPSVFLNVASIDEREITFLYLFNGTLFSSYRRLSSTDNQVYVRWSEDNGASWSSDFSIGNFLGETEEALAGYPIQLRNGTILMTLYDTGLAPIISSWVVWSDDMVSWAVLGQLDSASGIPSEWTIAQLRNETLWADIRGPSSAWWYSFSTDGGLTWEPIRVQGNISQFYSGVNAFPAFLQLASGNIFVGHRAQLEAVSAGQRSRVNLGILTPNPLYDSEVWFVLDAYDRVGEGHPDDYGYPDIIRISDGRYYFIWYDNSTSSIEGRLVIEPDLAPRQVTGIWTVVTNTVGIEEFTQYSGIVYTDYNLTTITATTTGPWLNITPVSSTNFTLEAPSGTASINISGLLGGRTYRLFLDENPNATVDTSQSGVASFSWSSWPSANLTLVLEEFILFSAESIYDLFILMLFLAVLIFGLVGAWKLREWVKG